MEVSGETEINLSCGLTGSAGLNRITEIISICAMSEHGSRSSISKRGKTDGHLNCRHGYCPRVQKSFSVTILTRSGRFDIHRLESSVERRRVDDVRVKVAVGLAVDKERHDDRDDEAHDHGDDDAHVERHIVGAGGSYRGSTKRD